MSRKPPLLTVVKLAVDRAAVDTAIAVLQQLAVRSRDEAGCARFEVLQQATEPERFITVELWADEAAADAHMSSRQVGETLARLEPLLLEPPKFVRYRSVER